MFLFFDTETTGLPKRGKHPNRFDHIGLTQIAVEIVDEFRNPLHTVALAVNAGMEVPAEAAAITGHDTAYVLSHGVSEKFAIHLFHRLLKLDYPWNIAHNAEYDVGVLNAVAKRHGLELPWGQVYCTKEGMEPVAQLPPTEAMIKWGRGDQFKSPTLAESIRYAFGEELSGAHDALVDTTACRRLFYYLMDRGLL